MFKVSEIAIKMDVEKQTVYTWIRKGQLKVTRIGKGLRPRVRITQEQLDEFMSSQITLDCVLLLTIDGQEAIRINGDDEIVFCETKKKIKLITHPNKNFYDILREKLGWG